VAPLLEISDLRTEIRLKQAVVHAVDDACEGLAAGVTGAAAAYEKRCALIGNRVRIQLLPKGETRGIARGIDRGARLELEAPSGLIEKVTVDQVRELKII